MDEKEYGQLKSKFLILAANVPLSLRGEIIALADGKPVSWNVAYGEVKHDTKEAKGIISRLRQIGVL